MAEMTRRQAERCHDDWERLKKAPVADVAAFAGLVLSYVGPVDDPFLDGDAELRKRATAILRIEERKARKKR